MLRPKEVCERPGISYRTLQRYAAQWFIKPVKLSKGLTRLGEGMLELVGIIREGKAVLYGSQVR